MKRSKLFRKKLLPLFLSVAVAGSQVPVMAADFGDTAVVSADADETERSQSIRNQGQTGESSEAGAEDGGTTQNDTDGVSVAGTSDTETEEISQGSDDNISEELDQDDRTDWTSPDSEENVFSDSTENTFGDGTGDGEDSQIEYIKGRPLTEEEEKEQLAPFDSLTSYTTVEPIGNDTEDVPGARAAAYPSYYNAADLGYVTSVKNQEPYGMCWAFGMASLLETSLLSQGLGTYDLSEEHLAYFFANRNNDPLGNTAGDINYHYGTDDYGNQDYHESGNDMLASFFLSTWSGMTTEEDVPMATDETHTKKTGVIPDASKEYDAVAYLKNAYFSDYSVSAMKKMVLANNAVTLMYNAQNRYYNADTAAYSYPSSTKSINHLVTVVGWDDNYSAKNFKTASNVTADGAWIVKNSWGENWGKNGYFYLSYQDGSINNLVAASATNQPKYTNNYFYDGTCGLSALAMYAGDKIASVFRASAGNGKAEKLGEVTLAALTTNNTYKVQVYTNLKNAKDPTSGTPAYATPVTLRQPMAGIMTFQIPEVLISQGSSYSIVVTNAGNATIKYYVEAEVSYGWCEFEPSILSGQSFRYLNSQKEWEDGADLVLSTKTRDIYGITYRIKAHTKTLDSPAKMQISNTSLSMYAGEKKSLSASATRTEMTTSGISWESSDTNIATVSSNGLVTAKHPGTVTISCYGNNAKGIRASCKVTVKLKQPAGLKITSKAYNKINLAWSAVTGCNYYVIYRSENGGKESKLTSMKSSIQSWSDTTVKTGNTYSYRVRAAYVCTGKTTLYGTASTAVSAKTKLAKAAASATAVSGPKNTVSWGKVPGASGYRVYRRTGNSDWERIAEVKSNVSSYQDSQIRGITSYTYSVRAYRNVDGKKVFGSYKESRAVLSYPDIQKISAVKKTSSGLKLYWRAQSRATFYNVYRKTKNSTWKKIGTVSGRSTTVSYEDKTAKKGTTYYYAVRAGVKTSEGKKLCGSYAAKSGKR